MADGGGKKERWWQTGLLGLFLLGMSVFYYFDLTKFEEEGGTRRMKWFVALPYQFLGKWGVVGVCVVLGGALCFWAFKEFSAAKAPEGPSTPPKE